MTNSEPHNVLDARGQEKTDVKIKEAMTFKEIEQFLTCASVGRIGISFDEGPYIVPVGYAYWNGKIIIHSCEKGLKMKAMRKNPNVCFEVDEALSDISMYKSVVIFGDVEIIEDEARMIPYLQKLIDKYRIPVTFDEYIRKPGRNRKKEMKTVKICLITPKKIIGRKMIRTFQVENQVRKKF